MSSDIYQDGIEYSLLSSFVFLVAPVSTAVGQELLIHYTFDEESGDALDLGMGVKWVV